MGSRATLTRSADVEVSIAEFSDDDIAREIAERGMAFTSDDDVDEEVATRVNARIGEVRSGDLTFLEGLLDELKRGDLAELRLKIERAIEDAR